MLVISEQSVGAFSMLLIIFFDLVSRVKAFWVKPFWGNLVFLWSCVASHIFVSPYRRFYRFQGAKALRNTAPQSSVQSKNRISGVTKLLHQWSYQAIAATISNGRVLLKTLHAFQDVLIVLTQL